MANTMWGLFTDTFGLTILHPQFIINRYKEHSVGLALSRIQKISHPRVIDIGCGRMPYRTRIESAGGVYVGVDHPIVGKLYEPSQAPDIVADVTVHLPIQSQSVDVVLLLQVMEYLDAPDKALKEISRILKKNRFLILTSPFMYPVHDYPHDKNRFTDIKLTAMLRNAGLKPLLIMNQGSLFEMMILSFLVFCYKYIQQLLKKSSPFYNLLGLVLLAVSFGITVPLNFLIIVLSAMPHARKSDYPINITIVAKKI